MDNPLGLGSEHTSSPIFDDKRIEFGNTNTMGAIVSNEQTPASDERGVIQQEVSDSSIVVQSNDQAPRVLFRDILDAVGDDYRDSPSRIRAIGSALLIGASQVADRARLSVAVTPAAANYAMEHVHNGELVTVLATGLAAAVTFYATNGLIAEGLNQGLDEFPKTISKFEEKYPGIVDGFTDSLAGVDSREVHEAKRDPNYNEELSFKETALLHAKRATTVIGIGPTPYVATAAANGYTKKERRKLHIAALNDTSTLVAIIGTGLAETVIQLANHGQVEAAKDIQDLVGYTPFWLGIAGLTIVSEFISNKLKKRKASKLEETN